MTSGWVRDGRAEEKIGGGYFVFRRGNDTGRIRPSKHFPFEHATIEAAQAEAARLAATMPGYRFDVYGLVLSERIDAPAPVSAEPVAA